LNNQPDPVFGLPAGDGHSLVAAGFAQRINTAPAGAVKIQADNSYFFGQLVSRGSTSVFQNCTVLLDGGAFYGVLTATATVINLLGFDAGQPFLIKGTLSSRKGAVLDIRRIAFDTIAGDAVLTEEGAYTRLRDAITAVGVTGFAVSAQHQGMVRADPTLVFAGAAGELLADTIVGTWAVLAPGVPLIGTNSGARIWEAA
jgi:hypothetical protein